LCTWPSSDPSSSQGISGGWRQQGRYVKSTLEKTASFIVAESLDTPPEDVQTSFPLPSHSQEIHVDNVLLSFFNHVLTKLQVRPISPDFRVEADLGKMHRATNVSCTVGQPIAILSHHPCTPSPHASYQQQGLLSGGPKAGICRVSRTGVDLPMRTFITILFAFLNKSLTSQGSLLSGSILERAASFDGFLFLFIQLQWVGASWS